VMKDVRGWEVFYADTNELVKAAKNSSIAKTKEENSSDKKM